MRADLRHEEGQSDARSLRRQRTGGPPDRAVAGPIDEAQALERTELDITDQSAVLKR
jgi:hypothetical protein